MSLLSASHLGRSRSRRAAITTVLAGLALVSAVAVARAQEPAPTGSISGRVTDERGAPLPGVQVTLRGSGRATQTRANGEFVLLGVPVGAVTLDASTVSFRPVSASVTVVAGQRATQDFTLAPDPLNLAAVVVTGTQAPRVKLDASVAVTTLSRNEVEQSVPRSTTEMLRYVPGFTRVESSGGEVNQNITMRGILGVEYVMFMEDGMPVFPTMHTFFMNADNLFRPDENMDRIEVVRGGTSSLFGSNTPGAIVNFINKTGGPEVSGTMKATAATKGLARYDFDLGGPLGNDWRFNVGGFYRYDHGVRDPGFPGIRGGQLKANVTRVLEHGYFRASVKAIDDRNQFILPLPFSNPTDPKYVPGFSDYGAMNTREGLDIRVPTPDGELRLPLDDGIRTRAAWLTGDAGFEFGEGWRVQNAAQVMSDDQSWNAILPFDVLSAADFVTRPTSAGGLGLPASTRYQFSYTNHLDDRGQPLPFTTANGLVAPGGEWHVEKPLTAFQDQLQVKKTVGPHVLSAGLYFANYSQDNRWFFTDILMDVQDNPRFLDLTTFNAAGKPTAVTKNGFRHYLSNYLNGSGQTTVVSPTAGAEIQLTPQLRADLGLRYEYNNFVQSSENTSNIDLDGDPATTYDIETWGNGTFRHLGRGMHDWAGSIGLNYSVTPSLSLYASGSRAYKMPALDEFLSAQPAAVDLFQPRRTVTGEGGVKYSARQLGFTVNGFYTLLKNIVGQGAVVDPATGRTTWITTTSPQNRAYGAEVEVSAIPADGLHLIATGTVLKAELGKGAGADIGSWLNGVPPVIGNLSATYDVADVTLKADMHYVGRRWSDVKAGSKLPAYNYENFGVLYRLPRQGVTFSLDLANAFQSKGLEEGNPRLTLVGGRTSDLFLARPILPRRVLLSMKYDF
ncbi:MAG TPA: TonB-dependent receptor [Longimicrobiales bacterium]|nr:TonB-dependent receptor [Longimicrobiales bacterium]